MRIKESGTVAIPVAGRSWITMIDKVSRFGLGAQPCEVDGFVMLDIVGGRRKNEGYTSSATEHMVNYSR